VNISCHVSAFAGKNTIALLGTTTEMPFTIRLPPQVAWSAHVGSSFASCSTPSRKIWADADLGSCRHGQQPASAHAVRSDVLGSGPDNRQGAA
jgi:hypothetical protein